MLGLRVAKSFENGPGAKYCLFNTTSVTSLLTESRQMVQ